MNRRQFVKIGGSALAATTVQARTATTPAGPPCSHPAEGSIVLPLNREWRYCPDKRDGVQRMDFDDSDFAEVVVPHTNIELPWHSLDDREYEFISTYRRKFRLPLDARSKRVFVDFEGVMTASTVWVNGVCLGEYKGGYTPFSFELTPHPHFAGDTYDICQTYLVRQKPDSHYLKAGKIATAVGTLLACTSSFIVLYFNNLKDYMALIAILFISPFFIIFLLGMLWKRNSATAGFYGMLGGLVAAAQYVLYRLGVLHFASPMAANLWFAVWGLAGGLNVMLPLTFLTRPSDPLSLKGLVFDPGAVRIAENKNLRWYQITMFYAVVVLLIFVVLNVVFFLTEG